MQNRSIVSTPLREIVPVGPPGAGNAHHEYHVLHFAPTAEGIRAITFRTSIIFQNGAVKEVGRYGIHNEDILAIVADRLRAFQTSPFACDENGEALYHIEAALASLERRTARRTAEGTEGTHRGA